MKSVSTLLEILLKVRIEHLPSNHGSIVRVSKSNHSWVSHSLDVGFYPVRVTVLDQLFGSFKKLKFYFSDAKPTLGDDDTEEDLTMLKKGKKRRILFTKVKFSIILRDKMFPAVYSLFTKIFSHKKNWTVNYHWWRFNGDTSQPREVKYRKLQA